jgi:hypothetical protein
MRLEFEVKNWEKPETAQKVSGTVTLRKKKPEFCRRLSGDQFAQRDQRVWQMRADGHTVQDIADSVGCGWWRGVGGYPRRWIWKRSWVPRSMPRWPSMTTGA